MSEGFKNIDNLFKSEFNTAPVSPPDFVKSGVDAGLGFGLSPIDDLFKSEMGDGNIPAPEFVKLGVDAGIGFGVHPLDDVFKGEASDGNTKVPEYVKTNIDQKLGFGNRYKYALLLLGLLLIGTTGALYITSDSSGDRNETSQNEPNVSAVQPSQESSASGNSTDQSLENLGNSNSTDLSESNESPNGSVSGSNQNPSELSALSSNSNLNAGENSSSTGNLLPQGDGPANFPNNTADGGSIASSANDSGGNSLSNPNQSVIGSQNSNSLSDNQSSSTTVRATESSSSSISLPDNNDPLREASDKSNLTKVDGTSPILRLPNTPFANPLDKKLIYKPWFVTAGGGINIARSFYQGSNIDEEQLYTTSMKDKIGEEFHVTANYRFKKGIMLGSGLNYSHFSEDFHFVDKYWMVDSVIDIEIIYDDSMVAIDTVISWDYDSTQVTNFDESGQNSATYFSIPINFGVQISLKKFRLDILATVRYNFLMNASGTYYDGSNFISYTKSQNNIVRKNYFDMMFAASLHYNIWRNFYISAMVKYRPVFGEVFQETSFNKKFHYTHIGVGISMNL